MWQPCTPASAYSPPTQKKKKKNQTHAQKKILASPKRRPEKTKGKLQSKDPTHTHTQHTAMDTAHPTKLNPLLRAATAALYPSRDAYIWAVPAALFGRVAAAPSEVAASAVMRTEVQRFRFKGNNRRRYVAYDGDAITSGAALKSRHDRRNRLSSQRCILVARAPHVMKPQEAAMMLDMPNLAAVLIGDTKYTPRASGTHGQRVFNTGPLGANDLTQADLLRELGYTDATMQKKPAHWCNYDIAWDTTTRCCMNGCTQTREPGRTVCGVHRATGMRHACRTSPLPHSFYSVSGGK